MSAQKANTPAANTLCCVWRVYCKKYVIIFLNVILSGCILVNFLNRLWKWLKLTYGILSFPVRIMVELTIPGSEPHDKCECLYH